MSDSLTIFSVAELPDCGARRFVYAREEYAKRDGVESSRTVLRRAWMDTKRKSGKAEMEAATLEITEQIKAFKPDLLFLVTTTEQAEPRHILHAPGASGAARGQPAAGADAGHHPDAGDGH